MKTNELTAQAVTAGTEASSPAPAVLPEPQKGGSYLRDPVTGVLTEQRPVEEA